MWGPSFIIRDSKYLAGKTGPNGYCVASIGPKNLAREGLKEQNAMRKVLVTFVLALTTAAWSQGSSPSQQPAQQPAAQQPAGQQSAGQQSAGQQSAAGNQQANTPTSQKVIKDPAEYNA